MRLLQGFLLFSAVVFISTTIISPSSVSAIIVQWIETKRLWLIIPNLAQSLKNTIVPTKKRYKVQLDKNSFKNFINKKKQNSNINLVRFLDKKSCKTALIILVHDLEKF